MSPILSPPPYPVSPDELRHSPAVPREKADKAALERENEQSFSFSDFLSIINPLQHIPIVGSIYRAITGDTIKPAPRVIGGLLFGGPMGLITSAFNAMVEQTKGKDLGEQALALLVPDKGTQTPEEPLAQHAEATPQPQPLPQSESQPQRAPEAAVAPLSRGLFGFTAQQSPANLPDRTLTAALRGANNTTPSAAERRTLADYRNFSGRALPVIDTARSSGTNSTAIRLQPTAPMPEKPRTVPAAPEPRASDAVPADAIPAKAETGPVANPAPTSDWFAAAMARGLDRYREQRRSSPPPAQIDTTL
jgi:hypothetical protein